MHATQDVTRAQYEFAQHLQGQQQATVPHTQPLPVPQPATAASSRDSDIRSSADANGELVSLAALVCEQILLLFQFCCCRERALLLALVWRASCEPLRYCRKSTSLTYWPCNYSLLFSFILILQLAVAQLAERLTAVKDRPATDFSAGDHRREGRQELGPQYSSPAQPRTTHTNRFEGFTDENANPNPSSESSLLMAVLQEFLDMRKDQQHRGRGRNGEGRTADAEKVHIYF